MGEPEKRMPAGRRAGFILLLLLQGGCIAALAWIHLRGGGKLYLGEWRIVSIHDPFRPALIFLLALAGSSWLLDSDASRAVVSRCRLSTWLFIALVTVAAWNGFTGELYHRGDGKEYLVQTQAIALRGELKIDTGEVARYWNRGNPFDERLRKAPSDPELMRHDPRFGGLYADRFGDYRYYHFWGYSLLVAPVYLLLHLLQPEGWLEYYAFQYANIVFLLLPLILAWRRRSGWFLLVSSTLLLASPLMAYVDWTHPELFCFFFIFFAFYSVEVPPLRYISPVFLGLAAAQNIPIALFLPIHAHFSLTRSRPAAGGEYLAWSAGYGAAALAALMPLLYYKYYFGSWSLIQKIGLAGTEYMSVARALDIFANPMVGALWFYPLVFLLVPAYARKKSLPLLAGTLASCLAASFVASATRNFHSGHIAALRYSVWILSPLIFFLLDADWSRGRSVRPFRAVLFFAGCALSIFIMSYFHSWELFEKKTSRFLAAHRVSSPEVTRFMRAWGYYGDEEVLVENIMGNQLPTPQHFRGIYVLNLGPGRSLWIISSGAARKMTRFAWERKGVPRYRSRPENRFFVDRGGHVGIDPSRITVFARHPVLGDYLLAEVDANFRGATTDVPLYRAPRDP